MAIDLPVRRLPDRRLWLLLAALSAAVAVILLGPSGTVPEPRLMREQVAPAKPIVPAVAVSDSSRRRADPKQTQSVQQPDQRKALFLYLLHGLTGHPLGILK